MAKGIRLRDADTNELYYPLTVSELVVDHESGETVKHRLDTIFDSPTITNPTINGGEFNDGNINRPTIKDGNIGGCNITETTITDSNIDSSELSNGNIHNSNITDSVISGDTYINEVEINDPTINNPKVEGGTLKSTNLDSCVVEASNIDSSTIHSSDINYSKIDECDLTNVRIKGTITDSVINTPTIKGGSISNVSSVSISGGKPTQFLKADGSIDETSYVYRNDDGSIHISDSECFKADTSKDNLNIAYTNSNGSGFAFEYDPDNLNIYGVDKLSVNSREVAFKDELDSTVGDDSSQKYVQRNSRGLIQMNGNSDGFWYKARNNIFDVRFYSVDDDNPSNLNQLQFTQNANNDGCLNIYATQRTLKFNFDEVALTKNYYTKTVIDGKFLPLTEYNANDILNKLKSVDGSGSGLDADLLRGIETSSNGDPNTIPVINENGMLSLQGIHLNPFVGELSEEGWYNVYNSDGDGSLNNESILLNVSSEYGSYLFAITINSYSSPTVSIVQLNGDYRNNVIPEIEVVTSYGKKNVVRIKYVPVFSSKLKIFVSGIGKGTFNAPFPETGTKSGSKKFNFTTGKGLKTISNLIELTNEDLNELEGLPYNSITYFYANSRNTCLNKPCDYHFFLTVSKYQGVVFQTLYDRDGIVWIRRQHSGVWNNWEQVATTLSTVEKAKAVVEQVLTNEDLNYLNYEVNTIYYAEEGNSCTNKPTGVDAFTLCNYGSGSSSSWWIRFQVLYPNSKDRSEMYIRGYYKKSSSSYEWKPWRKVRTNDDKIELPIVPYTLEYNESMSSFGVTSVNSKRITLPTENNYENVIHFILRLTITNLKNGSVTLDLPVYYDKSVGSVTVPISCGVYKEHEQATFLMGSIKFVAYGSSDLATNTIILKET